MITLIISTLLGIAGIIPPEHFEAWRWAMLIETMLDLPLCLFIMWRFNKRRDRREEFEDVRNDYQIDQYEALKEDFQMEEFFDRCAREAKNPYVEGTVRWYAWEERYGQDRQVG